MLCILTDPAFFRARRAQAWFADIILALVIFVAALVVYMRVSTNISGVDERLLDSLGSDAAFISETLVGKGYPDGWSSANVQKLGLTNGRYSVNDTKLLNAAAINYSDMKVLLGTRNDFLVFFQDKSGNVLNAGVCSIGRIQLQNMTEGICENVSVSSKALAKSERLVYRNGVIKMVVYSWRA